MKPEAHGGDLLRMAATAGRDPASLLDFSVNVRPEGPPEFIRAALFRAMTALAAYPSPHAEEAMLAAARHHGMDASRFVFGSGSNELIHALARVLRKRGVSSVRVVEPAFSEYAIACRLAGIKAIPVWGGIIEKNQCVPTTDTGKDEAVPTRDLLDALTDAPEGSAVFLANPGNPSGLFRTPEECLRLMSSRSDLLWIIDEAFVEYAGTETEASVLQRLPKNGIVLRSLTKFHAVPGVRLGYLAADAELAQAIRDALPLADRYPDPLCRTLRAALSRAEGVPQEHILCGNGAADLIFRLVWAVKPHKALVTAPTFAEYASALDTVGCEVKRFFLDEANDFAPTDALVDAVDESIDMVFLCQPNNPTGQLASPELVKKLLRRCGECHTIFAVDECFLDFLPDADGWTAKPLLESGNLVILKAFTKLYGMAGVRLGYCLCGDETLLEKMQTAGQPWAVSSLAQAAGVAALKETAYVDEVRALIARQRPVLTAGLRALGLRVIDGKANYLLFRAPADLNERLRPLGTQVRSCANYPGLGPEWYRTAVRTAPENARLLELMKEVLG